MRWLINYIRSCFCKHEWECLTIKSVYYNADEKLPKYKLWIYRCKKCGMVQKIKN